MNRPFIIKLQSVLNFEHQLNETADLVIGADGGMSKVRKHVTEAEIEDTGTFIIQGEVFKPETKCKSIF